MIDRTSHQQAVKAFLDQEFSPQAWHFSLPHGWGTETYFVQGIERNYFVKLGPPLANYEAMASLEMTPPVLRAGNLEDGISIIVQPYIAGRTPTWADYRHYLAPIAGMVNTMHHHPEIRQVLNEVPSHQYHALGMAALTNLRRRWNRYKDLVPSVANEVDEGLDYLTQQIESLDGAGTVASHNDICNANWIITPEDKIYLIDLDAMALDDPAHDLGALLWWYYPPQLRGRFLNLAGYEDNEQFRHRMRLRMAVDCLHILIPRESSFDQFDAYQFINSLSDFRAILTGKENPRGYADV